MTHYVHFKAGKYSQSSICVLVCALLARVGCVFPVNGKLICEVTGVFQGQCQWTDFFYFLSNYSIIFYQFSVRVVFKVYCIPIFFRKVQNVDIFLQHVKVVTHPFINKYHCLEKKGIQEGNKRSVCDINPLCLTACDPFF